MFDEQRLVQEAKTNPAAFGPLYDRYVIRILTYVRREVGDQALAEDITAKTFERALSQIHKFEWRGKSILAWFYTIARNEITSYHRREGRIYAWNPKLDDTVSEMNVEQSVQKNEQKEQLIRAMTALSAPDRELLTLRFLEGLPSKEVADMLGIKPRVLYVRVHRALEKLRNVVVAQHAGNQV